jgi:hypothetical protein
MLLVVVVVVVVLIFSSSSFSTLWSFLHHRLSYCLLRTVVVVVVVALFASSIVGYRVGLHSPNIPHTLLDNQRKERMEFRSLHAFVLRWSPSWVVLVGFPTMSKCHA